MLSTDNTDACACDLPLLTFASAFTWILVTVVAFWILWECRRDRLRGSVGWLAMLSNFGAVSANTCPSCDEYAGATVSLTVSLIVLTFLFLLQIYRNVRHSSVRHISAGPASGSEMLDRGSGSILITSD